MKQIFIQRFIKIFSLALCSVINAYSQKIVVTDLSYLLAAEFEQTLMQTTNENGNYTIQILTPRKYVNDSSFYAELETSDVILYYCSPHFGKSSFEIFIIDERLQYDQFKELAVEIQRVTMADFLERNKTEEGLKYAITAITNSLSKCFAQLDVPLNDQFSPGIDGDKLKIVITSNCDQFESVEFEVFSNLKTKMYHTTVKKEALIENSIDWDGQVFNQEFKYIRALDAPILVKVTLINGDSKSIVSGQLEVNIDKSVDEWNRTKEFFNGYIIKPDNYFGSDYGFYSKTLRGLMLAYFPPDLLSADKSPLDYMKESIVRTDFLGRSFLSHQKFVEKLNGVEENLKAQGCFEQMKNDIGPLISGSFALRMIANRESMSPHSLAAAIDIDPVRNPHIKDAHGIKFFDLIEFMTDVKLYNNKPTVTEMKIANERFKQEFKDEYIKKLERQSKLTSKDLSTIDNKLKYRGEFDANLQYHYDEITKAKEKYAKDGPGATQAEKEREQMNLSRIVGYTKSAAQLRQNIIDYIKELPSLSFSETLESKMTTDKRILLSKAELLQSLSSDTKYFAFDEEYKTNIISNIGELFAKFDNSKTLSIFNYVNVNREMLLRLSSLGFFEMDERLVEAFLVQPYIRWGGNYSKEKDFMHFEIYPLEKIFE